MFHFCSCSINYLVIVTSFVEWFNLGKAEFALLVTSNRCIRDKLYWTEVQSHFVRLTQYGRILAGKPEVRRPLGRSRRRWADNIRTDLQKVRCVYMDWIGLAQDRESWRTLVSAVMNLRVP